MSELKKIIEDHVDVVKSDAVAGISFLGTDYRFMQLGQKGLYSVLVPYKGDSLPPSTDVVKIKSFSDNPCYVQVQVHHQQPNALDVLLNTVTEINPDFANNPAKYLVRQKVVNYAERNLWMDN